VGGVPAGVSLTYYADKVKNIQVDTAQFFTTITAEVEAGFDFVQFYAAGSLKGYAVAVDGQVTFADGTIGSIDPIFPLAVDGADVDIDFWTDAFPQAATAGNRVSVSVTTTEDMKIGYRWRVAIDGTTVHEADIYPNGDGAAGYGVGYGVVYGHGAFGGGYGNAYGQNYGHGGGIVLQWISEPQFIGTYAVSVYIIDENGNVSTATTENVTLATYARPATDLAVAGYVLATDTLSLTWTESEDI